MLKRSALIFLMFLMSISLFGCIDSKGDKVLMIEIVTTKEVLDTDYIAQALSKGGSITLNVETCRQMDKDFDKKFAVSDKTGSFFVNPAIFNFVGSYGWKLHSLETLGKKIVWTKSY